MVAGRDDVILVAAVVSNEGCGCSRDALIAMEEDGHAKRAVSGCCASP